MRRYDVIEKIVKIVSDDTIIVCNIGDPCKELFAIGDRITNFYMLGSLGLASSIGFGLALSRPERGKVVVIDGDGGTLMNLGSLATIGRYQPSGLILVIVDNGAHGSTGDQPTATSTGCNLAEVSRACGTSSVFTPDNLEEFISSFEAAVDSPQASIFHLKVSIERPDTPLVGLSGVEIKERLMRFIQES